LLVKRHSKHLKSVVEMSKCSCVRVWQLISAAIVLVVVLQITVMFKWITDRASLPSQMTAIVIVETSTLWLCIGKLRIEMVYT